MNRRKKILIAALVLAANGAMAQTVEDGLKDLYYQKYTSANQDFQKVIAAKPTEDRAYYYQGLSLLGLGDKDGAAAAFQKGLTAVPNSPLLTAGLGRIDLLNGNAAAAKQKFEAADAATGGHNSDVARAIADANSEVKGGDRGYAASIMEKYMNNEGRKKKDQVTPSAADYIELGDAYRMLGGENGGKALTAYDKALDLDPKNAEAITKEGMLNYNAKLLEQAVSDWSRATTTDPNYGPAFYQLFQFYVTPKKNQLSWENAAKYLQSYIAVADPADKQETQYNQAAISFYQKNYDNAITQAKAGAAGANGAYKGKFARLIGDAYLQKGDSLTAKQVMDDYISATGDSKLEPNDYKLLSAIYGKVRYTGADSAKGKLTDSLASVYEEKYALSDTTKDADRYRSVAEAFKNLRDYKKSAEWYGKLTTDFTDEQNPGKIQDFFWKGTMEMYSNQYVAADSTFSQFIQKYPQQEILGTYWRGRANMAQDSDAKEGKAVPIFAHWAEIGGEAKSKPRDLMYPYQYLLIYYYNKEDKANQKIYEDKVLALDPNNVTVKQIQDNTAATEKAKAAAAKPAAKPKAQK